MTLHISYVTASGQALMAEFAGDDVFHSWRGGNVTVYQRNKEGRPIVRGEFPTDRVSAVFYSPPVTTLKIDRLAEAAS